VVKIKRILLFIFLITAMLLSGCESLNLSVYGGGDNADISDMDCTEYDYGWECQVTAYSDEGGTDKISDGAAVRLRFHDNDASDHMLKFMFIHSCDSEVDYSTKLPDECPDAEKIDWSLTECSIQVGDYEGENIDISEPVLRRFGLDEYSRYYKYFDAGELWCYIEKNEYSDDTRLRANGDVEFTFFKVGYEPEPPIEEEQETNQTEDTGDNSTVKKAAVSIGVVFAMFIVGLIMLGIAGFIYMRK
jgi:hypothetical protein